MKEIIVNVDNYNENSIKTIEGDNLSEVYKIYICKNKRRIDLTNKIAIMAYVNEYGNKKSNILALNITNASQGEIELPITNVISSENGVYACQVAIYGENNSLEQTAPFSLIVENNIFSKISNTAINSSDFQILSEAIKTTNAYGEKLKQGTENIELQYASILNTKANESDLIVQKRRIDNIISLPQGSTTGDAELSDGRIGVNGVVYANIGDAIRKQIKDVTNGIGNCKKVVWNEGGFININTRTGSIVESDNWKYTNLIDVYGGSTIKFSSYFGGSAGACFYDKNGTCIKKIKNTNETHKLTEFTVHVPREAVKFAYSCEKKVDTTGYDFIEIIGIVDYLMSEEKTDEKFIEKSVHTSYQSKNGYFDIVTKKIVNTPLFKCKTIDVNPIKDRYIKYSYNIETSNTPTKVILFLNSKDEIVGENVPYTIPNYQEGKLLIPDDAIKCVFTMRTGNTSFKFSILRISESNNFETVKDMISSSATGVCRVGGYLFRNKVEAPKMLEHKQEAQPQEYYDVNGSLKQYKTIDNNTFIQKNVLNYLKQEEIDFSPEDKGFIRIIVGKSDDDLFFVSHEASDYNHQFGNPDYDRLEVTKDFKTFTPIWESYKLANESDDVLHLDGITNIKVKCVKQFVNGDFLVGASFKDDNISSNVTSYLLLSSDFKTIKECDCTNQNGEIVKMRDEFGNNIYDWHVDVKGAKAICTTYGSRQPQSDFGRVWYTETCGKIWQEVFQMRNHYQDGVKNSDAVVTQTHIHGVMIDPYANRIFVLAGEDNQNIFWSDKGIFSRDNNGAWNVIDIRRQLMYDFTTYTQVVNGYAFKNSLILGSDMFGVGALLRLNKLDGGKYSEIEMAHEFLPNIKASLTSYCCAEMYRRDAKTPLFICQTRENSAETEELNEKLNSSHVGRVVATFDGVNFVEVWRDDTFGEHDVYIDGTAKPTTRKFSYCTRGMNCYLLKNGDIVIKYSGRDIYYLGGIPIDSTRGIANGASKVRIIKNAEKYFYN